MRARASEVGDVLDADGSDSALLDNALELLVRGGRDVRHALQMLDPARVAARRFAPAGAARVLRLPRRARRAVGRPGGNRVHGRPRRRRGARPQRAAAAALRGHRRRARGVRVRGGRDPAAGRRARAARPARPGPDARRGSRGVRARGERGRSSGGSRGAVPYERWLRRTRRPLDSGEPVEPPAEPLARAAGAAGFTREELSLLLRATAATAHEPTSSMGDDTALPPLAGRARPLFSLLPPALRAGDEPADRPPARARGDVAAHAARRAACCSRSMRRSGTLLELESFFLFPSAVDALDAVHLDATFTNDLRGACERLADGGRRPRARDVLVLDDRGDRRRDSVAAGARGRAAARSSTPGCRTRSLARRGQRRAAREPPLRLPARLRRRRDLPAARARDARGAGGGGQARRRQAFAARGAAAFPERDRGRRAQGDVEDGHLGRRLVPRRAALRRARPRAGGDRALLPRHARRRSAASASPSSSAKLSRARRAEQLENPGYVKFRKGGEPHATTPAVVEALQEGGARPDRGTTTSVSPRSSTSVRRWSCATCSSSRDGRARAARRGRARRVDRPALLERRHVPRRALGRGARDRGDRVQPARRALELRRGRRGPRALPHGAELAHQAGRVRPLRRHARVRGLRATSCRSRWRRARSPARAGSCPATR